MITHTDRKHPRSLSPASKSSPGATQKRARKFTGLSGLCALCNEAPTCTFPRSSDRPVTSCDEFNGTPARTIAQPVAVTPPKDVNIAIHPSLKGLCRVCERRETCTYPKPESGVWHCDEYA